MIEMTRKLCIILCLILSLCFILSGCGGGYYSDMPSDYYVRCDECNNTLQFTYSHDSEEGTFYYCYRGYGHIGAGTDCPVCTYNYGAYRLYDAIESQLERARLDVATVFDPSRVYEILCEELGDECAENLFDEMCTSSSIDLDSYYDPINMSFVEEFATSEAQDEAVDIFTEARKKAKEKDEEARRKVFESLRRDNYE